MRSHLSIRSRGLMVSIYIASIAVVSMPIPSSMAYAETMTFSKNDQGILNDVVQGSLMEIEVGNLAQKKGGDSAVRDVGKRISDDHKKINNQIQSWASEHNVKLPTNLTQKQKADIAKLNRLSGSAFDQEFLKSTMIDHAKDISIMQQYIDKSKNPEVRGLMIKTLPILENHIRVTENAAGKLGLAPQAGLNRPEHPMAG